MFKPITSEYTLVSEDRQRVLYDLAMDAGEGDFAELGVWKGGTTLLLARARPDKVVYAFDTFTGIPNADPDYDEHRTGDFNLEGKIPEILIHQPNVIIHRGIFPPLNFKLANIALAHFDGDTYQSCKDFIIYFKSVSKILVFDDYLWDKCPGVLKAIEESGLGCKVQTLTAYQAVIRL